jgi:hypothetical protein
MVKVDSAGKDHYNPGTNVERQWLFFARDQCVPGTHISQNDVSHNKTMRPGLYTTYQIYKRMRPRDASGGKQCVPRKKYASLTRDAVKK